MEDQKAQQDPGEAWGKVHRGETGFDHKKEHWTSLETVRHRHNEIATGKPRKPWAVHLCEEFLSEKPAGIMCIPGCGKGFIERQLLRRGFFESADASDISEGSLGVAREMAAKEGLDSIHYSKVDMNHDSLPAGKYDAVFVSNALHHIENLEHCFGQIASSLKPGGFLFFYEYVGAKFFAFGDRQIEAIRAAFKLIPREFRKDQSARRLGEILEEPRIPDPAEIKRWDPSESVRSDEIMPVLADCFDVVSQKNLGGGLLHILLCGIAGNFSGDDENANRILKMLFEIEDALTETGEIPSDFVVVAATPKRS